MDATLLHHGPEQTGPPTPLQPSQAVTQLLLVHSSSLLPVITVQDVVEISSWC